MGRSGGWTSIDGYYVAIVKSSTDFNKIPAITFDAGSVFSAQADISPLNILYKRNTHPMRIVHSLLERPINIYITLILMPAVIGGHSLKTF